MKFSWSRAILAASTTLGIWATVVPASAARVSSDCLGKGFLPENSLRVSTSSRANGMTEAKFNTVLDRVEGHYRPIISGRGAQLVVQRLWNDSTVNAFAERSGSEWRIRMYGGLARHEAITEDAFALIACHEIGHHLGGAPKYRGQWAANEGQADYFATLKCMRDVFGKDDNRTIVQKLNPPQTLVRSCERSFGDAQTIATCVRSGMAGLSAAELMRVLTNSSPISFDTPDPEQVTDTVDSHPAAQCRLDTYSSGAFCQVASSEALSETDGTIGTCSIERNFKIGVRPQCWYKPGTVVTHPSPDPTPTPTPPAPGGVARQPLMGGASSIIVRDPRQTVYIDVDVSEFAGAGGVYLEISRAGRDFSNPNSMTPDPMQLRSAALRGVRQRFFLNPAQALPGWGVYHLRVIPLDASGSRAVGRASNSSRLILQR
jgi:hypothetical protein